MGWGTFLAGRALSAARRDAAASARRSGAQARRDAVESHRLWVRKALTKSVLGHPKVRKAADAGYWENELARLHGRIQWWSVAGAALPWLLYFTLAMVAFDTVTQHTIWFVVPVMLLTAVGFMGFDLLAERAALRRIDAGFAKAGWPVERLRAEMRQAEQRRKQQRKQQTRQARRNRKDQSDRRLYPRP